MKKILSIFLISAMMISMFAGVTAFAATSQATGDGGTLWHKWDYENNSKKDVVNGVSGTSLIPDITSDGNGNNFGKFTTTDTVEQYVISTSNTIASSSDRYMIAEFDFKKDDTTYTDAECTDKSDSPHVYFYIRDSANKSVSSYSATEALDWTHTVIVIDKNLNANSKYTAKTYSVSNGVYTHLSAKDLEVENVAIKEFRVYLSKTHNPGKSFYLDNLELKTYGSFYTAINSASSVENAVNIINRYSALEMSGVSSDFANLTAEQKTAVASNLLNKNFESDAAAISALAVAMTDLVVVKTYLNWDFEDGTINDTVTNELFMSENPGKVYPVIGDDPTGSSNKTAVYNYNATSADTLVTFTDVMDNGYAAGEFKYLTYDFKVYGDTIKSIPVIQDLRIKNGASNTAFYTAYGYYPGGVWHQFKGVINVPDKEIKVYKLNGTEWELVREAALADTFGFYRLGFTKSGCDAVVYYDDFKVTGYNDVITEITEASADGVANVLEVYDEIGIVELPASYASLDAAGKAALGTHIKANTTASTTVAALNEAITLYLSNDELVVLSADATATALNGLKLAVKKDGVNLASSKLVVAAYDGTELVSVKVCDVAADGTVTGLGVDISNADSVKLMLVNNTQAMTPAVKATAWK